MVMCAWNEVDVAEVIAAADGCACTGRWCEVSRQARVPFPTVLDTVQYQTRDE